MHHVAFEVDVVGAELDRLAGDGAELVDVRPRPGIFGLEVGFVHPHATGGVLAELVSGG
jgi:methylmalonyl-CoA/ethylmalonyl-CoA epimerase